MFGYKEEKPMKRIKELTYQESIALMQPLKGLKRNAMKKKGVGIRTVFNNGGLLDETTRRGSKFPARIKLNFAGTRSVTKKKKNFTCSVLSSSATAPLTDTKSKSSGGCDQKPEEVAIGQSEKVQLLQYSRDYSFLSSESEEQRRPSAATPIVNNTKPKPPPRITRPDPNAKRRRLLEEQRVAQRKALEKMEEEEKKKNKWEDNDWIKTLEEFGSLSGCCGFYSDCRFEPGLALKELKTGNVLQPLKQFGLELAPDNQEPVNRREAIEIEDGEIIE